MPHGWAEPSGNLFQEWNCSAPEGGVDTIVRLSILPYARSSNSSLITPGDRYHHRGFKKDSLHLAEGELGKCQEKCVTMLRIDPSNKEASMMLELIYAGGSQLVKVGDIHVFGFNSSFKPKHVTVACWDQ